VKTQGYVEGRAGSGGRVPAVTPMPHRSRSDSMNSGSVLIASFWIVFAVPLLPNLNLAGFI
jgi:hypothetical protein